MNVCTKVLEETCYIITRKEIRSTLGFRESGREKRVLLLSLEEYPVEVNLEAEKTGI